MRRLSEKKAHVVGYGLSQTHELLGVNREVSSFSLDSADHPVQATTAT